MARKRGPIQVWAREDSIPTDEQGGYAGGDSVADAIQLFQDSVDSLAEDFDGIDIGVGSITAATDQAAGLTTISWDGTGSGGSGGGGGTVKWSSVTEKPSTFPPSNHTHTVGELSATGTASGRTFLRGDGTWAPPGNGAVVSGACLRFYTSGVEVHENESHYNSAVIGFGPNGDGVDPYDSKGRLLVKHHVPGPAVITVAAFPDETLSERGIIAGISGGVGTSIVQLVQNGTPLDLNVTADYEKVAGLYSNLWMLWVHHQPNGVAP